MIKKVLLLIFLSSTVILFAQKILVEGVARDTAKTTNYVHITVNDTLRKYRDMEKKTGLNRGDEYVKLARNKDYVTNTDSLGNYKIYARPTDTLHFQRPHYYSQKYKVEDIVRDKIEVDLLPEPCVPYVSCEQKEPFAFYIFVGEQIAMTFKSDPYYCNVITLDGGAFECTYKINQSLYGNYPSDKINFKAYDHYGRPKFSNFKNVMLFVGEYCGSLYHTKYQFFDVYKTKKGKWASPGDPYKYNKYVKDKTVKAQKIKFDKDVWIGLSEMYKKEKEEYKLPYYKVVGDKAFPLMGTYVDELIDIKKNTVLKELNIKLDKSKFGH